MKILSSAILLLLADNFSKKVQAINIGHKNNQNAKFPEDMSILDADNNQQSEPVVPQSIAQSNASQSVNQTANGTQKSQQSQQQGANATASQTPQPTTDDAPKAKPEGEEGFSAALAAMASGGAPKVAEAPKIKSKSSIAHVPLKNINNQQYTGELYFGQPPQKVNFQFDTGSAIVYVLTSKCTENCNEQPKFKQTRDISKDVQSTALSEAEEENGQGNRIEYGYGSGYINGYLAHEKICFSENEADQPCLKGITILEADQASGVAQDRFAGIIGLSPRSSEKQLPSFVSQVTDINKFSVDDQLSAQFSFYISTGDDSQITFGGYDLHQYAKSGAKEEDVFWASILRQEKYWTVSMKLAGLAEEKYFTPLYELKSRYAIMDTGVSYAILPTTDFLQIKDGLKQYGVECVDPKSDSMTSTHDCKCKDHTALPDIQIQLLAGKGESEYLKMFTLPRESYMENVGGGCGTLRLTPSDTKFTDTVSSGAWILGDIFLQNYYSIYDLPKERLGLVENKNFMVRKHADPPVPHEEKLQLDSLI